MIQQPKLEDNSIFSIQKTTLLGKVIEGEVSSSYEFITEGMRVLTSKKDDADFQYYLHEYSAIIKALVKYELLNEMYRRIDNIDTFYR